MECEKKSMYQHGGDVYRYSDCIDFSSNINYFGIPDSVIRAAQDAVTDCIHYPDVRCRELKASIRKKDGLAEETEIFCGNGAADVIFSLVLAKKPKHALILAPGFQEYEQALRSVDCEVEVHMLRREEGFELTERILAQITEQTDMLFLCNPNNPTGCLIGPELLKKILKKCEECDVLLVLDECFNEFLDQPERYSMIPSLQDTDHLFILKAFTKMYSIPGLRLGYGLCRSPQLLEQMELVSQPWRVSVPAQRAGIAAAAETAFVEQSRREISKERDELKCRMEELGFQVYGSRANYIFFRGDANLWDGMLEQKILMRDCSNYPGLESGYCRVAVRSHGDNEILLEKFREVLNDQ